MAKEMQSMATSGGQINKGCKAYAVELSAYFDGELEGEARLRVESHLADCPGCADTLQRLGKLRNALHSLAKPRRQHRSILDDLKARMADEGEPVKDDPQPC